RGRAASACPYATQLLATLGEAYAGKTPEARRRALQRDLEELVKEGRIEAVNPGGKPLRYRLVAPEPDEDQAVRAYDLQLMR
ncbi:MAG: WYL domain-containing protein, partial [Lamprocystis purpurea]|nr:WYL domain-containing protein [Lamprocystis purpurea]